MNNLQYNQRFRIMPTTSEGIIGGGVDSILVVPHPNYYPPIYGVEVNVYATAYPYGGGYYFF